MYHYIIFQNCSNIQHCTSPNIPGLTIVKPAVYHIGTTWCVLLNEDKYVPSPLLNVVGYHPKCNLMLQFEQTSLESGLLGKLDTGFQCIHYFHVDIQNSNLQIHRVCTAMQ